MAALLFAASACGLFFPRQLWGDSLQLMTDLEYRMNTNNTTTKASGETSESERARFVQIYNLDLQKELLPALRLIGGGGYLDNRERGDTDGIDSDTTDSSIRPYLELQLDTPLLDAASGYRKSEFKQSGSGRETARRFTEEYNSRLSWKPVELPEVDLYFNRNLGYNEPTATQEKIDNQSDTYQLISRYGYQNYRFDYTHTTNDGRNNVTGSESLVNSDSGSIRYNNSLQQGKITLNGSLRLKHDRVDFRGPGPNRLDVAHEGSFHNPDDRTPVAAESDPGGAALPPEIPLVVASPRQISFGLDFGSPAGVDSLLIGFADLNGYSQADFSWQVFARDFDIDSWAEITPVQVQPSAERLNGFLLSFSPVTKRYIKIVTFQRNLSVDNRLLNVNGLVGQRTLPADSSEFSSTAATTNLGLNWKMTAKTSSGYDFLYREERTDPFNGKRSQLSNGITLSHRFDDTFAGNLRLSRSDARERGKADRTGHNFSSSLAARYLDTFNQSLTYSFSHLNESEQGTDISNALLLRNNLVLYEGLSMNLDGSFSVQNPADGQDSNTTTLRLGSNIIPNRWMNISLFYDVLWNKSADRPQRQEQTGRFVASWVPLASLSLTADLLLSDKSDGENDSFTRQQYFLNWSPLRDGTLQLSVSYGAEEDTDGVEGRSLSPTLRWAINQKTLFTLNYSLGERENLSEISEFETIAFRLRFFY